MSLAEELLADLEEVSTDIVKDEVDDDEADDEIQDIEDIDMDDGGAAAEDPDSIRKIAKLRDSSQLLDVMSEIDQYKSAGERKPVVGPVEADPEYQLIVRANNVSVEMDNEINVIHKFVKDHYQARFPELESLVPTAMEYLRTVRELGNDIQRCKTNEVLPQLLQSAAIMIVSVTASTTQGKKLEPDELARVMEACNMAIELQEFKDQIFLYVESRMSFIAPNISLILGAATAAKLMGLAGGLTKLCNMPACNMLVLGAMKRTLSGFSTTAILPHTGFIYYSEFVQKQPPDIRRKTARLLASKCALAARVDAFHESSDGTIGQKLRSDIEAKIDKWLEPPPVKQVKPLPAPIDAISHKRGGRRARKLKERLGLTEIRRAANRMNFGEIEDDAYQSDLGFTAGNIGKSNSGKLRAQVVDSKTKARISKTLQQKVNKANQSFGGSTTIKKHISGTASSVAFTPLQGLEIVNPHAAEQKAKDANDRYFSSTTGFSSIKPTI